MEINRKLFFKTPEDKYKVFQKPRLLMFSEGREVESWSNTQPLYFYPFSWLDYLSKEGIRELYIIRDASLELVEKEIESLKEGKVHFEQADIKLINFAKERGHKVSVICNIEELSPEYIQGLSVADFVRIRVDKNSNLYFLSNLPNRHILSCIKVYVGEGCNYHNIALQAREIGFDFIHVAKRLENGSDSLKLSTEEQQRINDLKTLETKLFKVIIPSSLEEKFAKRFLIRPELGNISSCDFSKYRRVLKGNHSYPCYTERILNDLDFVRRNIKKGQKECLDCACIYENDMLHDIILKMKKYKNPVFALEYMEDGK